MKMKETLQIGKTEFPNAWQLTNKKKWITKKNGKKQTFMDNVRKE